MFFLPTTNPILIAAAVIPAVILLNYIYHKDRLEKEPRRLLIGLVILGVVSTALAVVTERLGGFLLNLILPEGSIVYNALMYFGVVACSEEGAKYILLKRKTWKSPEFNCQFDGVVYAVFVSLGFALWENIGYVAVYGLSTALVRAITAVPGHACFGVFMGAWYGMAKRYDSAGDEKKSRQCRRRAFWLPVLIHGAYDFIATLNATLSALVFVAFVAFLFFSALGRIRKVSAADDYFNDNGPTFF